MEDLGKKERLYCCLPECHNGGWQYETEYMPPGESLSKVGTFWCARVAENGGTVAKSTKSYTGRYTSMSVKKLSVM